MSKALFSAVREWDALGIGLMVGWGEHAGEIIRSMACFIMQWSILDIGADASRPDGAVTCPMAPGRSISCTAVYIENCDTESLRWHQSVRET